MVKEEKKALYEGMYIINPILSEEASKKAVDKITASIEGKGGEVHKIHDQGRQKLAYEINGHRQGYYFLLYFSVPTSSIKEIWRDYHLNEDLVRFVTLRADEVKEKLEFKQIMNQA